MEKFNEALSDKKVEALLLQTHIVWCSNLKKNIECDVSQTYDLFNHAKVPNKKEMKNQRPKLLYYITSLAF